MNFSSLKDCLRQRLAEGIADRSLTGSYIARELGVSQAHISNVVHGKRDMSFDLADRLLEVITTGVEDLVASEMIAERVPFEPTNLGTFVSVPVIVAGDGLRPKVQHRSCADALLAPVSLFPVMSRVSKRSHWIRGVAVAQERSELLVIDRYCYCPGVGTFALYLTGRLWLGSVVDFGGKTMFWPQGDEPRPIDPKLIIGKLVQKQTSL